MRVNGHNDQCVCGECGLAQATMLYTPTEEEQLAELDRIDRKFDQERAPQGADVAGVPNEVGVRAELPLNRHVLGSRIVGAVELDHVAPTGRIVAVVIDVDGARWALWWDRTANGLIARPMRKQAV